ncbi:sulfatase family protein [Tichowtungia aerotolerans]|uniref:Sulfatase-like hydrolase/transferase n=1 Tax=Tichowtungia aerotolerans TaxID=2697043 RepID=A0A6P1M667_9BACT|nr:sulfatase [Tichowtungia aerotolerans]QHI70070.1 sulfatase-like hydrolase/transferase [Tichowtungia aerotolerans]
MKKSGKIRYKTVAAMIGLVVGLGQAAAEKKPNILYIMADDQRYDTLGCTGNPVLKTPNIDRLAEQGVSFSKAFATTPICCVSRVSVLTGQYARRHGVHDFFTQVPDLGKTYPGILQQNGYYTGFIGKWGTDEQNQEYFQRVSSFFDFWGGSMHQSNYWHERDCRFVKNNGTTDRTEFQCDCPPDARGAKGEQTRVGRKNIQDPIHQEIHVIPQKVEQFLSQRDADKPFCLSISLKAPHGPWGDYADEVKHLFEGVALPVKASVDVTDAENRPDFLKNSLMNPQRGSKLVRDPKMLQEEMRHYYRLIAGIDICMGKILASLKEHDVDDNTVIIYTSDHGHFLGEHGFDGKWLLYEESAHIPMILYDPRNPVQAQTSDELALLIDMAPTMLDLAEIKVPKDMQGKSLLLQLTDPAQPLRDSFFMEHLYGHGPKPPNHIERSEGVRTRRWKYINYIDQSGPQSEELYDLENDPMEMHNLAGNPEFTVQFKKISSQWRRYREELK